MAKRIYITKVAGKFIAIEEATGAALASDFFDLEDAQRYVERIDGVLVMSPKELAAAKMQPYHVRLAAAGRGSKQLGRG